MGKTTTPEKFTGFTFRGKEIVLSKTQGAPFKGLKAKGLEQGIYPEEMRLKAVTIYAATGHFGTTAELSKVPEQLVRTWRKQEWFMELLKEIRQENNAKIDAKFTEIIESSLEQLTDRIQHGDHKVLRDGSLVRVPVAAKDLSLVAAINVDKRQLLRGEPTSRSESIGSVEEKAVGRLEKLAETFENLARVGKRTVRTIENQVEDAQIIPNDVRGGANEASPEGHTEGQISQGEV